MLVPTALDKITTVCLATVEPDHVSSRDAYRKFFQGGEKLGPHKRMTLAIMIIAYIYTSICLLRFALFA